ncbi:hypothetical protein Acsp03_39600 [Actinomadura sp. NBRC 104412]|uniref:MFS transporter n=1 Tax=Actinomadura sp. NBRC 104412 TaxID=3032203 RepID=UPI0024A1908A|nr:MFS transporter [Actinomadura sp. NBRC 104412]GLZ06494.1 hypothetical protein Acsp03_39600 [Actinomadura sp. NBRC 104412]
MTDKTLAMTDVPPWPERSSSQIRRARAGIYAIYAAEGLAFTSVISRGPQVQRAYLLDDTTLNLLVALVPVIAVVGGLVTAKLTGRAGSGTVLRCAQVLFYLSLLSIGLVDRVTFLFMAVVFFGIALGMLEAAMNAHAVAIQRHAGRSLINGFFATWSAAGLLGALWASLSNELDLSLTEGFLAPVVLGLVTAAITGPLLLPKRLEGGGHGDRGGGRNGGRDDGAGRPAVSVAVPWRPVLVIGGLLACAYVTEGAVMGFGAKYLGEELRATATVEPFAIIAFSLATLAGRAVADLAVRRRRPGPVVRAGALTAGAGLLCVFLAPAPAIAIAGFGLTGLGLCSVAPAAYAAAGHHDSSGLGVAVARVSVFSYVGTIAGTVLVALLQPLSNYRVCFVISAVLVLVVVPLAGRFDPGRESRPQSRREAVSER